MAVIQVFVRIVAAPLLQICVLRKESPQGLPRGRLVAGARGVPDSTWVASPGAKPLLGDLVIGSM